MAVYKEINRADDSGVTTFYRISDILDTVETDDKESQSVVIDYNQAQNKPSINGVALVGNKTSEDLGLQPAGDYITNNEADEKFIDEDELEAKNYVNQAELQDAIAHIEHFHREIVEALPVTGMDNVLYMVRKGGTGEDIYNEYIWVGLSNSENGYEFLGTTATDLTDYYKKSQVDAALATKVDKEGGKGLSEENYTLAEKTKLAGLKNYDDTEIQAEVSGLNTDINNLKKSNVTISNTLAELKPDVDSNTAAVSTIYDLLDNKMTAIRLVEQGDGWVWMNLEGSRLTYAQASAALGHENCMLFIEQLENDGKVIPAEYKSEGDHINVIFKDLDSLVHIMTCGEDDVVVTKDVTTTNGQVDFTVEDEAIGYTTKMTALYGKSTQETTTGKNLLSVPFYQKSNTTLRTEIPNFKPGTYTFHFEMATPNGDQVTARKIVGGVNTQIKAIYNANTLTFDLDEEATLQLEIYKSGILLNDVSNAMLAPGSIATEYEPYTGGQPSPSPDYPQEIKTITGNLKLTSCGKNLFDMDYVKGSMYGSYTITNNIITFIPSVTSIHSRIIILIPKDKFIVGQKYTIKANGCNRIAVGYATSVNDTSNYVYFGNKANVNNISFTYSNIPTDYVCIYIYNTNSTLGTNWTLSEIQLEKNSTATEYEPYQGSSLNITIPENEFLGKIGDIKDTLNIVYKDDGRYHAILNKKIGKVVLDGSESWNYQNGAFIYKSNDILQTSATNEILVLSNYYKGSNTNYRDSIPNFNIAKVVGANTQIGIKDNRYTTIDDFKTWLSTHNVEVYYALETPIDIEITDPTLLAQLNALEQITQYKHTYITITGDDLTPEADFTYINNVVINNTDSVLGKDTYWNDEVPTQQDLPSKAQEGEIRIVQDTEGVYIYNGTKWIPFDKNSEVDLSNYLTKDNTTPWVPTGPFNPSTKKYVDDSVGGIHVPTKTSQLQNDSNFVIKTTNELTNYYTKNNTYTKNEVDALVAGGSGASDYSDLTNKPKINNVELSGNKSLSDLGIINLNNVLDGNAIGSARTIGAKDSEGQPLGDYAWAEGKDTIASGILSHAEGVNTIASESASHAEGAGTRASGYASHVEGGSTRASGDYSHAEGASTIASGNSSHAEGNHTTASGNNSHAEGDNTTASGIISHAEGGGTTAQGNIQHVQGKFNIADTTSAHIVGNGSSISNKSNAHTLDWNGNAWFAGDVYVKSTSGTNKDSGSKKLATEEYVTNLVGDVETILTTLTTGGGV